MPRVSKKRYGRRVGRKRIGARKGRRTSGFLSLKRKHALIAIQSSATAGSAVVIDAGGASLQCVALGTPVASVGTVGNYYDVPFSMTFAFNQLVNSTEFSTVFDSYKLRKVKATLQCSNNISGIASTVGGQIGYMPYLEYSHDYDDGVAPNASTFRERMGIKTRYFNATTGNITMSVYPKCAPVVSSSIGTTNSLPSDKGTWLNMTDRAVPHYGIKGVIRRMYLPAGAATQSFQLDITTHALLKDVV